MSDVKKGAIASISNAASLRHSTRAERVALRCAYGDAAVLCDIISDEIRRTNPGRKRGSTTKIGIAMADAVKRAGDAIAEMRAEIEVPAE